METRLNKLSAKTSKKKHRPVTFKSIQDKQPDRTFYIKDKVRQLNRMVTSAAKELYHSLSLTFSMESVDLNYFNKFIWPLISSGAAFVVGEFATTRMSHAYADNDDYDFVFKFLIGSAILGYCAAHRINEKHLKSSAQISAAVASEVLAITYLYTSTFRGSQMLLAGKLSDNYSLVASLGASALVVPGGVAYLSRKLQEKFVKKLYVQGAQRSDSATISGGLTSVSNSYFQMNHFLTSELITGSRLFQLGLISDNILNAQRILQRFRNLPALIADAGPAIVKSLISQREKLEADYQHNTAIQKVLRFTEQGPVFFNVPRYKLRNGDLVYCDHHFDFASVPVSGEIIAFERNDRGQFVNKIQQQKFSVNLKAHNGEDVWIEFKSKPELASNHKQVDLHAIHEGKQAAVLSGDKLNLYGADNFFIQIKPEKERILINNYQKTSVINQIITERKQKNILFSILVSIMMAGFLQRDITQLPTESIRLLFNLFQMMIPFSESFLREMINSRLLKELNDSLDEFPMEIIDALRIVDLCNAVGGYYQEKFPKGVAIVSDKTGTLTTPKMDVLGLWTSDMSPQVSELLAQNNKPLLPDTQTQLTCFEVFASAFTNEKKELEPEEYAILQLFKSVLNNNVSLDVVVEGNNHLEKRLSIDGAQKKIETFHLGLFRSLGGRLTLVNEGNQKYLVFCGVPKRDKFHQSSLLNSYLSMNRRTGVLSRDWCIARTVLSDEQFDNFKSFFDAGKKVDIEQYLESHAEILKALTFYCTFIVNNPVKKGAENFISQCSKIGVPVFVATGDTAKASENIVQVLFPENSQKIITIYESDALRMDFDHLLQNEDLKHATIIFVGTNKQNLEKFKQLLALEAVRRPAVIFAEMSTEGKGVLTQFLKDTGFFVVANGDGTNDIMMMKNANVVISHLTEDATHAPGIAQLSNLNDRQLQNILGSDKSFYELFDIQSHSAFTQAFTPLANSQEKPSVALTLKSSKMGFELAHTLGVPDVKEMPQQHWYGVAFDLIWLWLSFQAIKTSTDLPVDNQHIGRSNFINKCMLAAMAMAFFQALATYSLTGESTNLTCMLMMLTLLPVVLHSIFSGFGEVQNELHPSDGQINNEETMHPSLGKTIINFFGSLFHKKPNEGSNIEDSKQTLNVRQTFS